MNPKMKPLAAMLPVLFAMPVCATELLAALDPVVVSATRQQQRVSEAISSVNVIERAEIEQASSSTLGEFLSRQPGVEYNRTGGRGASESLYIRGTESKHALVLLDGIRFGSASLGTSAIELIPLNQIERIEIIAGPASSIYGSDAIGGVVNVITRSFAEGSKVVVGAGNRKTFDLSAATTKKFDALTLSAKAGRNGTEGINSIQNSNNPFFNADRDGVHNSNFAVDARYAINADAEIGASYLSSVSDVKLDNALYNPGTGAYSLANQNYETRRTITRAEAHAKTAINSFWRSSLMVAQGQDQSVANLPITLGEGPQKFSTQQDQVVWQNDLKLPVGQGLVLFEHLKQSIAGTQSYDATKRVINALSVGWNGRAGNHGFQLNAREDRNSQFGDKLTYNAGYAYYITQNWRLSATRGTAFKAPTFDDLYYPNDGFGQGNPLLKPESSTSNEFAIRYDHETRSAKVAWYKQRIDNLIQWAPTANPYFWTPSNVGGAEIRGLELQGSLRFGDYRLSANANFQDPHYLTTSPDGSTQPGDVLRRRAKEYGSVQIGRSLGRLDVEVQVSAAGRRNEYTYSYSTASQVIMPMGGYALTNVFANWQLGKESKLFLQTYNLFDRQYELAKSSTARYATPGRSVFVGYSQGF